MIKYQKDLDYGIKCGGERTKQSFKDDCNVNKIMARYSKTGQIDHVNDREPQYGDAESNFQERMNIVAEAKSSYEDLPDDVKSQFESPEDFVEFSQDPKNAQELFDMGLMEIVKVNEPKPEEIKEKDVEEGPPPPGK